MSAFSVFLSYPTNEGYSDFVDITGDVLQTSLSKIKQSLEEDEFDVGKITFDNIKLVLRNEDSTYSEASNATSIFELTRDRSIVRIVWDINSFGNSCGNCACGLTFLSAPRTVFEGLIEENSAKFDVRSQNVTFTVLGKDSVINREGTPFSSLAVSQDANTLLFNILNQTAITQFFTVDLANINCNNNFIPDSIAHLEGTTALEAIQDILLIANSILFVKDGAIFIQSRASSVDSQFVFYGASSNEGIENIINISNYGIGLNRTFNAWVWEDTAIERSFADSIQQYGRREKEIFSQLITNTAKINVILESYLQEFGFPKTELTLSVPMYTPIVDLGFLDKVNIDYPSEVLLRIDETASKYEQARYDSGFDYNRIINSLFISISQEWKILNKGINVRKQRIEYKVREV